MSGSISEGMRKQCSKRIIHFESSEHHDDLPALDLNTLHVL